MFIVFNFILTDQQKNHTREKENKQLMYTKWLQFNGLEIEQSFFRYYNLLAKNTFKFYKHLSRSKNTFNFYKHLSRSI